VLPVGRLFTSGRNCGGRCFSWQSFAYDGISRCNVTQSAVTGVVKEVDLSKIEAPAELEVLGLETLKAALSLRGLKCGGSLKERAERLFLAKSVPLDQMPKQHIAKSKPAVAAMGVTHEGRHATALAEELVGRMGELLADCLEDTADMIEKKQARTFEEIERDLQAAAEDDQPMADEDEEEDDKPIYNPLNLPLGWDGKPIPYWLYKLHGLNLEFKCEICGNYSYWGPRAFERHFQEFVEAIARV